MIVIKLYEGTGTGLKSVVDVDSQNKTLRNQNNIGVFQVVTAGNTVDILGSCDGTNFMTIATAATSTVGKTISLMPFMRVNVTVATGTAICYLTY
jgi:hypothetical protein